MRVTYNSFHQESITQINRNASNQAQLQQQISSGQKITTADQDPATAQRILSLQSASAQTQQYYQNAGAALDISKASYSAIDSVRSASDRIGELTAGTSDLTTPAAFDANAKETDGLIEQAVTAANQQFDGKYLLGGTKTDTPPFSVTRDASGQITGVSYVGAAQGASMQVADNSSISPYTDGTSNSAVADFINKLVATRDAFQNNDSATVAALKPGLQDSEDSILSTLGQMGAQQKTLQNSQDAASSSYDSINTRIGTFNDVNLAQATIDLTKSQTAYQASLQATAKIMQHSLLDYV